MSQHLPNSLRVFVAAAVLVSLSLVLLADAVPAQSGLFDQAMANGVVANEGFRRCRLFVQGWLAHADPKTGLIPQNLTADRDIWNAKDSAADNYPFMVLTAAITDGSLFDGRMLDMLRTETALTSQLGTMPDTYSFSKGTFADDKPDISGVIFGSSEYIKDGRLVRQTG